MTDVPEVPADWTQVRGNDPRWFHHADQHEIKFHRDGAVSFTSPSERLRMSTLTLTTDELDWVRQHRDWLKERIAP